MVIVLVRKPYITKGDDRLQLFSMLEIYLLVCCAMILEYTGSKMDDVLDTILSICLIILTLLIAIGGLLMIGRNLRKMYFERKRKQLVEQGVLESPDKELTIADETEEEQVLSWATKVRLRAVQLPKKLVAPPKAPPRMKPARPPRKRVESVAHAHKAPTRYGGRELSAHDPETMVENDETGTTTITFAPKPIKPARPSSVNRAQSIDNNEATMSKLATKNVEPETGAKHATDGQELPQPTTEKAKPQPPRKPARQSQAPQQSSQVAESKDEQAHASVAKQKSDSAAHDSQSSSLSASSSTDAESVAEAPTQARPAKPAKVARQTRA